ncbi:acyl-CoA Delta-9 desaturase-like [Phlebotomus argentipes]|uniref:acyl-CoA Delta-9 desaturase-like n=1 Tax=Phlebotomus argentipes TaxID=94469 RepID=UPI0028930BFD|nr:acyl-CoA Delta-9 desaturase-like [Phlebotomus argentipes]XP_059612292.1 acyl-CoA Delta-9 desaturase-like [Phlebotomus argentipes]
MTQLSTMTMVAGTTADGHFESGLANAHKRSANKFYATVNDSDDTFNNNNNNEGKSQLNSISDQSEYDPKDKEVAEEEEEYEYLGIKFKQPLKVINAVSIIGFHLVSLYAFLVNFRSPHFFTVAWAFIVGGIGGFGVTAGAHRHWSHKAYKAKTPLRVILALCFSVAGQNTIFDWTRDHRVHHKFSETDADPHNSNRGFFFAHVGWLMMKKHPDVIRKGNQVDMSDILADPVVQWHQKYFVPLKLLLCFVLPTITPVYMWNEEWIISIFTLSFIRYVFALNFTWLVNSAAHMWGNKPYDRKINPSENLTVSLVSMGEGWHNYHHTFPWDYKAAEFGDFRYNITTSILRLFAKIGWAYDLKEPSQELIRKTIARNGDGSHHEHGHRSMPDEIPMEADENSNLVE